MANETFWEKVADWKVVGAIATIFLVVAGVTMWPSDYKAALEESSTPFVVMDNPVRGYTDIVTHSKVADYQRYKLDKTTTTFYKGRAIMAEGTWLLEYWKTYGDDEWVNLNRKASLIKRGISESEDKVTAYKTIPFYAVASRKGLAGNLVETVDMMGFGENKFTAAFTPVDHPNRLYRLIWRVKLSKHDITETTTVTGICRWVFPTDDLMVVDACDAHAQVDKFVFDAEKDYIYIYFKGVSGSQVIDPHVAFYNAPTLDQPTNGTAFNSTGTTDDNTYNIWFNCSANISQTVYDLYVFNGSFNQSGGAGINQSMALGYLVLNKTGLGSPYWNTTSAEAFDQGTYWWLVRGTSAEKYGTGESGNNFSAWSDAFTFTVAVNCSYTTVVSSHAFYNDGDTLVIRTTPAWPAGATRDGCIIASNHTGVFDESSMTHQGSGVYNYTIANIYFENQYNRSYLVRCNSTSGHWATNDTTYRWGVVNRQPGAPTATGLATNNSQTNNSGGEFMLNWTAVTDSDGDAVTYSWEVYNDSAFSDVLVSETTDIVCTNDSVDVIIVEGDYYWRVRTVDNASVSTTSDTNQNSTSAWSGGYLFRYEVTVPTAVTLNGPNDHTNTSDNTPFFNWTTTTEANFDHYEVLFTTNGTTYTPVAYNFTTTVGERLTVNYTPASNMTDAQYAWKVRACQHNKTCGAWSGSNTNLTIDTIPPVITITVTPEMAFQGIHTVNLTIDVVDTKWPNTTLQPEFWSVNVTGPNGSEIMPTDTTTNRTFTTGEITTPGVYRIIAWMKDLVGNAATAYSSFWVVA